MKKVIGVVLSLFLVLGVVTFGGCERPEEFLTVTSAMEVDVNSLLNCKLYKLHYVLFTTN